MGATLVTYEKVLINDVTLRKIFHTFKTSLHFLEQVRKMWPKSPKTPAM